MSLIRPIRALKTFLEPLFMSHDETKLKTMLSYARPAGSRSEERFITRYIDQVSGMTRDLFGNRFLEIPTPSGARSIVVWSSHTDTVASREGKQEIVIETYEKTRIARRKNTLETGACLGADCTAGVWIMLEMIAARVPGLYIFHREEEIGGNGSSYIADHGAAFLAGKGIAVAFDRRGLFDIITHQMGARCASDTFATSFATRLNKGGFDFGPDDSGTFTDTVHYTRLISECTNISVGYYDAHSPRESLNLTHLFSLRDAMLAGDWETLTVERDPSAKEELSWSYWPSSRGRGFDSGFEEDEGEGEDLSILSLVRQYPEAVASILTQYGITASDILSEEKLGYM